MSPTHLSLLPGYPEIKSHSDLLRLALSLSPICIDSWHEPKPKELTTLSIARKALFNDPFLLRYIHLMLPKLWLMRETFNKEVGVCILMPGLNLNYKVGVLICLAFSERYATELWTSSQSGVNAVYHYTRGICIWQHQIEMFDWTVVVSQLCQRDVLPGPLPFRIPDAKFSEISKLCFLLDFFTINL